MVQNPLPYRRAIERTDLGEGPLAPGHLAGRCLVSRRGSPDEPAACDSSLAPPLWSDAPLTDGGSPVCGLVPEEPAAATWDLVSGLPSPAASERPPPQGRPASSVVPSGDGSTGSLETAVTGLTAGTAARLL